MKSLLEKFRIELHQIPEIANNEFKTKEYLKQTLSDMGYTPKDILDTGLYVYINNKNQDTIMFRSDIDALPTLEETNLDYSSKHTGYMHACGHDGHMSMLLGLADYLKDKKERLTKNILLVFQPAEESIGGAERICNTNLLQKHNVTEVYGIHLYPEIEEGIIASKPNEFMASANLIKIEVFGKSSHGAMPELGIDANLILSKLLIDLQSIQTRNVSPIDRTLLTFGVIGGGKVRNTISDYAYMEGSLRTFHVDTLNLMITRMKEITKGYEIAYNCKIKIDINTGYLPVINDEDLFNEWKNHLNDFEIHEFDKPLMIAEDFSFYQQIAKGLFYYVGTKNIEKGYIYSLHSSKFNFSINALEIGLNTYKTLLHKKNVLN